MNSSVKKELEKLFGHARNALVSEIKDELAIDLSESNIVEDVLEDLLDDTKNVLEDEIASFETEGIVKDKEMETLQNEIYSLQQLVEELEDTISTWEVFDAG